MRKLFCTWLVLFGALPGSSQNSAKHTAAAISNSSTNMDTQCGPAGCIDVNSPEATRVQAGAPVVIRSVSSAEKSSVDASESRNDGPSATPTMPNDFEKFVATSLGHSLPVFGSTLFRTGHEFAPPTNVSPSADYLLGTGDEVLIRTWGKVDIDVRAVVDRNGQIFVPRVGTLTVAGLRLDQLTNFLHGALDKQFLGFELSVSLGQLRSIQIFVLGQARSPGVYTISSLSTLVNSIFLSGGPSATGSLRDIQLRRGNSVITHFDIYSLLLSGDKSADVRLQPGDIIFIPLLGPQVAVDGNVSLPAIYELKSGATVGSTLAEAGGLTPIAGKSRAVLEHVIDHSRRSIEEFALDTKGLSIPMQTGDILRIFPISPKITDAVTLRGNVAEPGRYRWHAGLRITDIIPSREALLTRSYYNRQNALNLTDDDTSNDLKSDGKTSSDEVKTKLHGATKNAPPAMTVEETEINWNYAVIQRLDPADLTTRLVPFALGEAIANPGSSENKELQAGDVLIVYSQHDVALPLELQAKFVRVDGQVKSPGVYRVGQNETLRDLVARAGGLVPHAYLYAAQLTRESVRVEQEAKLQTILQQESRDALSPANSQTNVITGPASSNSEVELRKAYIEQLNKVHPDGRIILQLSPEAKTLSDVPDFMLEDGDHFFVPTIPNTVEVLGTVYNQGTLRYLDGSRAGEYLNAAGGATRYGDRKREFIIRADGTLVSRQKVSGLERLLIYPGDAVIVPPKLRSGSHAYDITNLMQMVSTLALSAVAVRALQ